MRVITAHAGSGEPAYRLYRHAEGVSFESDYVTGKGPRGPQQRNALIHMGLSMWISEEAARKKNDEFGGKLGDMIAVLELRAANSVWWAETFSAGHITVWGRSEALHSAVLEVHPV